MREIVDCKLADEWYKTSNKNGGLIWSKIQVVDPNMMNSIAIK
jgi:hypothetical protein